MRVGNGGNPFGGGNDQIIQLLNYRPLMRRIYRICSESTRVRTIAAILLLGAWIRLYLHFSGLHDGVIPGFKKPDLNIVLLETVGYHDEVTAALYFAVGNIRRTNITMFLTRPRFGIEEVYSWMQLTHELSPVSIQDASQFGAIDRAMPDLIISVTSEFDTVGQHNTLQYYLEHGPKHLTLLCVSHHPDRFSLFEESVRPWAQAGRLRYLALSTHTALNLREEFNKFQYYGDVPIDVLPPIFPVPLETSSTGNISISLQGNFDPDRRDYRKTFEDLDHFVLQLPEPLTSRFQLTLLGSGNSMPDVPERVRPYISIKSHLDYIPYYQQLHESFALIPAFADDDYYTTKASSTIPAAFIGNVPILSSQRLSDAYTYMSHESMWLTKGEESEISTVRDILSAHFDEFGKELGSWEVAVERKRRMVQSRASEMMEGNVKFFKTLCQTLSKQSATK